MKNNPYSISEENSILSAITFIKEQISKGQSLETIEKVLNSAIKSCNTKLKRNSFNIDELSKRFQLENKLKALNILK